MLEFIQSPMYDWLKKHKPTKSFVLCSPFIKNSAFKPLYDDILKNCPDIKLLMRGEKFDFTYPDSSSWSPVIFSHEFESSDVERNVNKTLTWNKTTEVGVARYIQFKFTLVSDTRSSEYVPLNLVSFTLTWSC